MHRLILYILHSLAFFALELKQYVDEKNVYITSAIEFLTAFSLVFTTVGIVAYGVYKSTAPLLCKADQDILRAKDAKED